MRGQAQRASTSKAGMPRRSSAAIAAILAQFSQAAGSVLLQFLAGRLLGAEGLGSYALAFGVIVTLTAVTSGLVGDSLTVLDRSRSPVRAGLQVWLGGVTIVVAVCLAVFAYVLGWLDGGPAVWLGIASAAFVLEDIVRRLLMALTHFWRLVIIDLVSLAVSLTVVVTVDRWGGGAGLSTFFAALAAGQLSAIAVGLALLPGVERWIATVRPDARAVWRYGSWRALQQTLRPAMLTVVRAGVAVAVGTAALGELEAARLYVAPAMLMVGGAATYLFASYARDRHGSLVVLRRRADRAVMLLVATTTIGGVVAAALVPWIGDLIVRDATLDLVAVIGWVAYATATAAVTPYGSLAAVRGRQATVLAVRAAESVLSVIAVGCVLALDAPVTLVPVALAAAAAVSGVILRRMLADSARAALEDDGAERLEHDPDVVQ